MFYQSIEIGAGVRKGEGGQNSTWYSITLNRRCIYNKVYSTLAHKSEIYIGTYILLKVNTSQVGFKKYCVYTNDDTFNSQVKYC